jgi:hypothetical protein
LLWLSWLISASSGERRRNRAKQRMYNPPHHTDRTKTKNLSCEPISREACMSTDHVAIRVENTMNAARRSFVLVHGAWHGAFVWQNLLLCLGALPQTSPSRTRLQLTFYHETWRN